jgi:hypothetical protein
MPIHTEAGAGIAARAPALENAQASQAQRLQNIDRRRISQAELSQALAVSDGRHLRGYVLETKGASLATDPDGAIIGAFATRRQAFHAISTAAAGRDAQPSNDSAL